MRLIDADKIDAYIGLEYDGMGEVDLDDIPTIEQSEDCISIEEAIEVIAGADETDGNEPVFSGKQVIKMLKDLPPVTPRNNLARTTELNRVLGRIITQIEQVRDKDKLCEYPYNRCINIIKEEIKNENNSNG